MNRLISVMYILDQMNYEGWFGLDLFPYRDDSIDFMKLSVENLRYAQRVVDLMNEKGARELRKNGSDGPAISRLLRDCMSETK
jgi:xylose isomerase